MPLGKEVGLGPGHILLDGHPVGTQPPQQPIPTFGPCLLWPRSPISATAELLLYNEALQQTSRPLLLKLYERRQI